MVLIALVAIFMLLGAVQPAHAHALDIAVQDQGADPDTLIDVAHTLGARTVRIISRPGEPHLEQVAAYHHAGLQVQAAIQLKRWSTPNDVRHLLKLWGGKVQTVSIGNEPELNGLAPCAYASIYRRTYALVRREFPGVRIGVGEQSPGDPVGYMTRVLACDDVQGGRDVGMRNVRRGSPRPLYLGAQAPQQRRSHLRRNSPSRSVVEGVEATAPLRADFYAIHPYQFWTDPLATPTFEKTAGNGTPGWTGLGNLRVVRRFLDTAAQGGRDAVRRLVRMDRDGTTGRGQAVTRSRLGGPSGRGQATARGERPAARGAALDRQRGRNRAAVQAGGPRGARLLTPAGRSVPIRCTEFSYLTSGGYATTPQKAAWMWPRAIKQARRWCQQLVIYGLGQVNQHVGWGSASLLDGFGQPTAAYRALARALGHVVKDKPAPVPPIVVRTPLPDLSDVLPPDPPDRGVAASQDPPGPVVVTGEAPAQEPAPAVDEPVVSDPAPSEEPTDAPA